MRRFGGNGTCTRRGLDVRDHALTGPSGAEHLASASDDQVHCLRPFTLLVGLDIERDALPFGQRLESGALNGSDVHEYVSSAVIRLDESVAALAVEKLDRTGHCHRETPIPVVVLPPAPTARQLSPIFAPVATSARTGFRLSAA